MGIQTEHMTKALPDELEAQIAVTNPGMAYFADTGPFGRTCADCAFLGYRRESSKTHWSDDLQMEVAKNYRWGGCEKFMRLTGRHGPPVPPESLACKYFEAKK